MHRFWSILFFLVPILGTVSLVWAMLGIPPMKDHWLPENINTMGAAIDHLFYLILILTGVIFIGTGLILAWFLWKYPADSQPTKARFIHGSHKAELIWSVIPGIILLFLSFYQIRPWAAVTMDRPTIMVDGQEQPKPPEVKVIGRQFNWDFQYPGPDGKLETLDDLIITDTVGVLPIEEDVVVQLEAEDVLHSFFVAKLRVKQDIVPGMKHFVWFHATKADECEIACTELCGWGHYKMKAKLILLPRAEYEEWLEEQYEIQNRSTFSNDAN